MQQTKHWNKFLCSIGVAPRLASEAAPLLESNGYVNASMLASATEKVLLKYARIKPAVVDKILSWSSDRSRKAFTPAAQAEQRIPKEVKTTTIYGKRLAIKRSIYLSIWDTIILQVYLKVLLNYPFSNYSDRLHPNSSSALKRRIRIPT